MNVELVNKSTFSDESLQTLVDFLAPCFGHTNRPVKLVVRSKSGYGVWGLAQWPNKDEHVVEVNIGTHPGEYPRTRCYKKRAGPIELLTQVENIFHTMAHELRHVEQFEACLVSYRFYDHSRRFFQSFKQWEKGPAGYKSNSCEVDAETVAHGLVRAYRDSLNLTSSAPAVKVEQ
jgi:hypothetical protein